MLLPEEANDARIQRSPGKEEYRPSPRKSCEGRLLLCKSVTVVEVGHIPEIVQACIHATTLGNPNPCREYVTVKFCWRRNHILPTICMFAGEIKYIAKGDERLILLPVYTGLVYCTE